MYLFSKPSDFDVELFFIFTIIGIPVYLSKAASGSTVIQASSEVTLIFPVFEVAFVLERDFLEYEYLNLRQKYIVRPYRSYEVLAQHLDDICHFLSE